MLPVEPKCNFDREMVSVICVTSDRNTAHQLSMILAESRRQIDVEWLKADANVLEGLSLRLASMRRSNPAIVLLDFSSCGATIWRLVSCCNELLDDHSVEWLIVNCEGSIPSMDDFPWGKVTVLANSLSQH